MSTPPEATGVKSLLKYTVLPLVLVVVVVFGVTLISLGVNTDQDTNESEGRKYSPPLFFSLTGMVYNPSADTLAERTFPGYYEPTGGYQIPVSFWFRNPHPVPVQVAILGRSCTSCSSARLAILPPERLSDLSPARVALVGSVAAPEDPDALTTEETQVLGGRLQWQDFNLDRPEQTITVPPGSVEQPTWGVLQFGVALAVVGPKPLEVNVGLAAGDNAQVPMLFRMMLVGAAPFEVTPGAIQLGDLREGSGPITRTLTYWSSTRGLNTDPPLAPPTPTLSDENGFIRIGKAVPLNEDETKQLEIDLTVQREGGPIRVRGAYQVPVTIYRHAPPGASPGMPSEPDIGPLAETIGFTTPGTPHSVSVQVTANIVGLVSLVGSESVDLKDFNARTGVERSFRLVSDRDNLSLRVLPDESKPKFLTATLGEPFKQSGRQFWDLKVGIPPVALAGTLPPDSVIVLEAKTSDGTRKVRIPVKAVAAGR